MVQNVDDVHVKVALAEAVIQVLAALKQSKEDVAGRLVARLSHCWRLYPVVGAEAAWNIILHTFIVSLLNVKGFLIDRLSFKLIRILQSFNRKDPRSGIDKPRKSSSQMQGLIET